MDVITPTLLLEEWGSCKWVKEACLQPPRWQTSCGKVFEALTVHDFEYCPYCGKPINDDGDDD